MRRRNDIAGEQRRRCEATPFVSRPPRPLAPAPRLMRLRRLNRLVWGVLVGLLVTVSALFAQNPPNQKPTEIPGVKVDVISTTPLPGLDLPLNEIAAPVQGADAEDIEKSGALDLADFLNRRLTNV